MLFILLTLFEHSALSLSIVFEIFYTESEQPKFCIS